MGLYIVDSSNVIILYLASISGYVYAASINLVDQSIRFRKVSVFLDPSYSTRGSFKNADVMYFASSTVSFISTEG